MRTSLRGLIATGVLAAVLGVMTAVTWTGASNTAATPMVADGQALFHTKGCIGCHTIIPTSAGGSIGPALTDLPERAPTRIEGMAASDYIRQSIEEPDTFTVPGYGPGIMPALPLTDTEVDTLVGYLLEDRP